MTPTEWKEKAIDAVRGEFTLAKLDFCLIGAICFLAGICIGMIAAPLTHGITILSHNANNGSSNFSKNGNNHGNQYEGCEEKGGKS